eukprot:5300216-Alexandrium_andersonii.AAC.1
MSIPRFFTLWRSAGHCQPRLGPRHPLGMATTCQIQVPTPTPGASMRRRWCGAGKGQSSRRSRPKI